MKIEVRWNSEYIFIYFGYHGDLKATANINMILAKLLHDLKENGLSLLLKDDTRNQLLLV